MDWLQALALALVQGLTEFLPISSSAHLVLTTELFGWPDQGLAFDVAVHVGSMFAVLAFFAKDFWRLADGSWRGLRQQRWNADARMAGMLVVATLPAGVAGLFLAGWVEAALRNVAVIAWASIGFGLLMGYADWRSRRGAGRVRALTDMRWGQAALIGVAQALALIPGTSRAGITITAGLLAGFGHRDAARFSFLLATPLILASGALKGLDLALGDEPAHWPQLIVASAVAGVVAWLCIHYFLRWVERVGLMPFVAYRLVLGAALLALW